MKHRIFILTLFSLFLSTRGFAQWDSLSVPYNGLSPLVFAVGSTVFAAENFAGNAEGFGSLWRSSNNGDTWQSDTAAGAPNFTCFVAMGSNLFLGTQQSMNVNIVLSPGGVLRSTDDGLTWQARNATIPDSNEIDVSALAADGNVLLRGSWGRVFGNPNEGLFASTDSGATWNQLVNGRSVGAVAASGGNIVVSESWASGSQFFAQAFVSTDTGSTWQPVLGIPDMESFAIFGSVGGNLVGKTRTGMFVSSDNGLHWVPSSGSAIDTAIVNAFATAGNTIFAATGQGLFHSTDEGFTWRAANEGFGSVPFLTGIAANSSYLFVGRDDGTVWRRPLSDFSGFCRPRRISSPHSRIIRTHSTTKPHCHSV